MLKNLEKVNENVIGLFRETAKLLIEQHKGDAERALCQCLAYLSGHYKDALINRSLLTGQENQMTLQLTND